MKILKNVGLLFATLILAFLAAASFDDLYSKLFGQSGTYVDLRIFSGFPLAYVFILTLLFTVFGGTKKYWWIGILLIPAAMTEVYLDITHIYFPIALALLGWGIGFGISKLMKK